MSTPRPGRTVDARIAALSGHPLHGFLLDQQRIQARIAEDPPDLFPAGSPDAAYHDELTAWERSHLQRCLDEWLGVLEGQRAERLVRFDVRAYGARGDGTGDDAPAIRRAIADAARHGPGAEVRFPAGRYRLVPAKYGEAHLLLAGVHDIALRGEPGAELLASRPGPLLRCEDCDRLRLSGLAFDYDPLLFSQGTVVGRSEDGRSIDWCAAPGYPTPADWGMADGFPDRPTPMRMGTIFTNAVAIDAAGRPTQGHLGTPVFAGVQRIDDRRWRFTVAADWDKPNPLQPGDGLLLTVQVYWIHGVTVSGCRWCDIADIDIWGACQFALYLESCTGVSLRQVRIRPKPGSGRLGGINRDGIHCRSNRFGPFIADCVVEHAHDDCFNLQSKMVSVDAVVDRRTLVLDLPWDEADRLGYWTPRRKDWLPGDLVAVMDPVSGAMHGWAVITGIEERAWHGQSRVLARVDRDLPDGIVSREALGKRDVLRSSMMLTP